MESHLISCFSDFTLSDPSVGNILGYSYSCIHYCDSSLWNWVHAQTLCVLPFASPLTVDPPAWNFPGKNTREYISYSRESSWPGDWSHMSCISCTGFFTTMLPGKPFMEISLSLKKKKKKDCALYHCKWPDRNAIPIPNLPDNSCCV